MTSNWKKEGQQKSDTREIEIPIETDYYQSSSVAYRSQECTIKGTLTTTIVEKSNGIVIFTHGSGSSGRHSPRNQYMAKVLSDSKFDTLLVDLFSEDEQNIDNETRKIRFDIELLANRVSSATEWVIREYKINNKNKVNNNIGYFGASTGAAAVLMAAVKYGDKIRAIVSRGGRPDLAGDSILKKVHTATLLLVGGNDIPTLTINQKALQQLENAKEKRLVIVPGAGHLFEEKGTLEEAGKHTASWFEKYI